MNAKEMRLLTDEVNQEFVLNLQYYKQLIMDKALNGDYCFYYRGYIKENIKLELEALGYTVEDYPENQEVFIKW